MACTQYSNDITITWPRRYLKDGDNISTDWTDIQM